MRTQETLVQRDTETWNDLIIRAQAVKNAQGNLGMVRDQPNKRVYIIVID